MELSSLVLRVRLHGISRSTFRETPDWMKTVRYCQGEHQNEEGITTAEQIEVLLTVRMLCVCDIRVRCRAGDRVTLVETPRW